MKANPMFLDPHTLPPEFVIEVVPGAAELADEYRALRDVPLTLAAERNAAADAASALTLGSIAASDAQPRPGVDRREWEAAIDAYRDLNHRIDTATRAASSTLAKLHRHVEAATETDAFQAKHDALITAANKAAERALTNLRAAVEDRDRLLALAGRRVEARSWYGIDAALADVTAYVTAEVSALENFRIRASRLIDNDIMLVDEKRRFAEAILRIEALNLTVDEKLAMLKRETGR